MHIQRRSRQIGDYHRWVAEEIPGSLQKQSPRRRDDCFLEQPQHLELCSCSILVLVPVPPVEAPQRDIEVCAFCLLEAYAVHTTTKAAAHSSREHDAAAWR